MNVGDIVVVTVDNPVGADSYKTKGKCGIVIDICDGGETIGLNDSYLYRTNELRPATETEKRAYLTALGIAYCGNLIDVSNWIKEETK